MADEELESEVWGAISAFEQIVEAMPNDKASLEALAHAYEHIGDHIRSREYSIRLLSVFLDERTPELAKDLVAKLRSEAGDDPEVIKMLGLYDAAVVDAVQPSAGDGVVFAAESVAAPAETAPVAQEVDFRSSFDISEELAFAWNLLGANELSQDEYSSVVEDLTEMSAKESVTISMLHVLYDRGFRNLERILGMTSKECSAPLIAISQFDLQKETLQILPLDFMVRRGCLLYEQIGGEGLVAVLNPYDKKLREDIERLAGHTCHYFLIHPEAFDEGMARAKDILAS